MGRSNEKLEKPNDLAPTHVENARAIDELQFLHDQTDSTSEKGIFVEAYIVALIVILSYVNVICLVA